MLISFTVNPLKVDNVKKIAILRANALGDFIVTLPAIDAIRQAYPKAEIILLGKPWHKEFAEDGRTAVDRVIVIPVCNGLREEKNIQQDEGELEQFFNEMQDEQFDIAIHFHGKGIAANPFIKKLGARLTVGLTCNEAEPIDRSIEFYYYQNEMIRYLEVASLIGALPVHLEPHIKVLQKDKEEADKFLAQHERKPFIVLHPCGTDTRRMWTVERFAETADQLIERSYQVIFSGNTDDALTVNSIIEQMKHNALNACGKFSLGGLAGLLSKSDLVISSDTGPLHLARATGAKTIGLYWSPNLINWGPLTRNRHRPVISWKMECPVCGTTPNDPWPFEPITPTCEHKVSFIENITAMEVIRQADELLSTPSHRS